MDIRDSNRLRMQSCNRPDKNLNKKIRNLKLKVTVECFLSVFEPMQFLCRVYEQLDFTHIESVKFGSVIDNVASNIFKYRMPFF